MTASNGSENPVLVTGASGFVGQYVVKALLEAGLRVRLLVRSIDQSTESAPNTDLAKGDILDRDSLTDAMTGCRGVVHLVGIIRERSRRGITFERIHIRGTENVVRAAREAGIETFIHMSANGAMKDSPAKYPASKWAAEQAVRNAGFNHFTIFRPSIIFGKPAPGRPEFASQLVETLIRPFPVWPVFGDGKYRLQPVAVENVAAAFAAAVTGDRFSGKTYCVAGPQAYSYLEILDLLAKAARLKIRPKLHQPLWLAGSVIGLMSPLDVLPITSDQLKMLVAGNTCDPTEFIRDFEIKPDPFNIQTLHYLAS